MAQPQRISPRQLEAARPFIQLRDNSNSWQIAYDILVTGYETAYVAKKFGCSYQNANRILNRFQKALLLAQGKEVPEPEPKAKKPEAAQEKEDGTAQG